MPRIVAFVPDMMDRSRLSAAAAAVGVEIEVVRDVSRLAESVGEDADLVLLDLGRPGALDALADLAGSATVGFASHVDRDLIKAARRAGCSRVLARSAFFSGLGELLASAQRAS